jgi:hypothetical protein
MIINKHFHRRPTTDASYSRSLERRIINYLGMRQLADPGAIEVRVIGGTAILRGRVINERVRYRICECCRHVAGIYGVIDQIEVAEGQPAPASHRNNQRAMALRRDIEGFCSPSKGVIQRVT